ncbi:steroid delta-isomerase [Bacillus sp. BGMRC 2118]|nr:steroid delta-isomerase [Bacillus sp. BGMRC 2118]
MYTPDQLAQKQLDAYNKQDIEAFVSIYADDIVVMDFPSNEITLQGKEEFRTRYHNLFLKNPNQHAELKYRLVKGNIVIDHEYVTGRVNGNNTEAIAMYEVDQHYIRKVWFVK